MAGPFTGHTGLASPTPPQGERQGFPDKEKIPPAAYRGGNGSFKEREFFLPDFDLLKRIPKMKKNGH